MGRVLGSQSQSAARDGSDPAPFLIRDLKDLVHDLLRRHGAGIGAQILNRMNEGASFDHAFTLSVGMTPVDAEAEFWKRQHTWAAWLPTLTSSTVMWLVVTALALLAILRHIIKNRAFARRWAAEENDEKNFPDSEA